LAFKQLNSCFSSEPTLSRHISDSDYSSDSEDNASDGDTDFSDASDISDEPLGPDEPFLDDYSSPAHLCTLKTVDDRIEILRQEYILWCGKWGGKKNWGRLFHGVTQGEGIHKISLHLDRAYHFTKVLNNILFETGEKPPAFLTDFRSSIRELERICIEHWERD
jgi:hypothetical protein